MKFEYVVESHGEMAAGIRGFTEEVCIEIKDFVDDSEQITDATEHFRKSIAEWYDGAGVTTKAEYKRVQAEIDKAQEPEPEPKKLTTRERRNLLTAKMRTLQSLTRAELLTRLGIDARPDDARIRWDKYRLLREVAEGELNLQ